jgi:microcystin degradation protein MlrC
LYRAIPSVIDDYDLLDASILVGYLWADEPRSTASVITLGMDSDCVNAAAGFLARRFWENRRDFRCGVYTGSVDDCIRVGSETAEKPVVISDSGDNPTAGGAGDVPHVLERLLDLDVSGVLLAGLADRAAVASCIRAGVGARVAVDLGGKLDPNHGKPLEVTGDVISIHPNPRPPGEPTNRTAVLKVEGVRVVLTERRTPFHHLDDFHRLGVDPEDYEIVVVKIGYLVPELKKIAATSLLALSPGAVNQNIFELPFERLRRPMYPFDPDMEWTPPERSLV